MSTADPTITLTQYIDSGLYGHVWKGKQDPPDRDVAIKIVNQDFGVAFNAAEHARGLVKAGPHPNIVEVYLVTTVEHPDTKEPVDAVVMEWLDGKKLGIRLAESPLITCEEARRICDGVFSAVAHLHENGVTHSDLHVGNIILTERGPRIIDIDYSSAQSLRILTSLARQHRINADITQLGWFALILLRRTAIDRTYFLTREQELQSAQSINEVRELVAAILDYSVHIAEIPPPTATEVSSNESLERRVEHAIERRQNITLRRIIMGTASELADQVSGSEYPVRDRVGKEGLRERASQYRKDIRPFLPALGSLGYWGSARTDGLLVEAIDRLANAHERTPLENGNGALLALRRYPVISAFYAAGIGAIAGDNYRALFSLLRKTAFYKYGQQKEKLWTELAYWAAENQDLWNQIRGSDSYFPVSVMLEEELREPLAHLLPSDIRYRDRFNRFELFASLEHFLSTGRALGVGFLVRGLREGSNRDLLAEIQEEARIEGDGWKPVRAGLLDLTDKTNVHEVLEAFRSSVQEVRQSYRIW